MDENMKFTYEECLRFISEILNIKLTDNQKFIIKAMMSDNYCLKDSNLFPRGATKTPYCSKIIAAYVINKYDNTHGQNNHMDCLFIKRLKDLM